MTRIALRPLRRIKYTSMEPLFSSPHRQGQMEAVCAGGCRSSDGLDALKPVDKLAPTLSGNGGTKELSRLLDLKAWCYQLEIIFVYLRTFAVRLTSFKATVGRLLGKLGCMSLELGG
ncbi:hypothetical protein OsI_38480 [Oryza sativa Indica Group]|nr:hypothetical protein OsI_38480 [Oryza sativa Indica Group]